MLYPGALILLQVAAAALVDCSVLPSRPFDQLKEKRQATTNSTLQVDLGYEVYQGVSNQSTGLSTWKG